MDIVAKGLDYFWSWSCESVKDLSQIVTTFFETDLVLRVHIRYT